jgi:lactoylglutathione lyase
LAVAVPDVYACVARLEKEGVKIIKAPDAGSMKGLAFVADPDGYSIEVFYSLILMCLS